MKKLEHNVTTGEIKEVTMTSEEIALLEATNAEIAAALVNREAAKQAILDKLGLTAEELAAVLS